MSKEVLIVGAGKIGRGFIGQLFHRSGYRLWFMDASPAVVNLLNKEKQYRVDIAGEEKDETEYIPVAGAFTASDKPAVQTILRNAEMIVSSVGAANIETVAAIIGEMLKESGRQNPLNWIICENAERPAQRIKQAILQHADAVFADFAQSKIGLVETQVLRTGMTAKPEILSKEPLAVRMQDWWTLPLDKDAFIGPVPDVLGFKPRSNFANELTRKIYTFNGTNGPIAYVGWANGFHILHESALAYPLFFREIQNESAFGITHEFGIDAEEQQAFAALAIKKYTDPAINDQIERNAHDSRRKLGEHERLVGPALLCLKYGRMPYAYAKAIAAAYFYSGSTDAGTCEVQRVVNEEGIENAITKFSSLPKSSPLYNLVLESYQSKSFIFN